MLTILFILMLFWHTPADSYVLPMTQQEKQLVNKAVAMYERVSGHPVTFPIYKVKPYYVKNPDGTYAWGAADHNKTSDGRIYDAEVVLSSHSFEMLNDRAMIWLIIHEIMHLDIDADHISDDVKTSTGLCPTSFIYTWLSNLTVNRCIKTLGWGYYFRDLQWRINMYRKKHKRRTALIK